MIYELRHFDDVLLRFSATEDTSIPEIEILWVNDDKRELMPLDLSLDEEGIATTYYPRPFDEEKSGDGYNVMLKIMQSTDSVCEQSF